MSDEVTVGNLQAEVSALIEELAAERLKNEVLMSQILKAEDALVAKDVESFNDVIPNEDKEGYLAYVTHDAGVPEVKLPSAISDLAVFLILDGTAQGGQRLGRPVP